MPSNTITIFGNITKDPELRFTQTGQANAKFGVAVNRRWQNRQTQEWQEEVSFFDVIAWGQMAENVAESFSKGDRVIVTGRHDQRSWETPEGQKRYAWELVADEIGGSIKYASIAITKNERREYGSDGSGAPAPTRAPFDEEPL